MTASDSSSSLRLFLRWLGVHFAIVAAAILFVAAIALVFYRSLNLIEPSSIVDVQGAAALDGAMVEISGPGLNAPLKTSFDKVHGFTSRFFLDRGSYTLSISRDGRTLFEQHFFLGDHTHATLPVAPPSTQPAKAAQ